MKIVELETQIPEENLAIDEVLLDLAERGLAKETMRFWESEQYSVVLGRAGRVREECFLEQCKSGDVAVLRRISGGGTVLQGPGCLNYSLVLSYGDDPKYKSINGSYNRILTKITGALKDTGINSEFMPISDLAIGGKKFSGNAQARKKRYFLHHGTILYSFDLEKITEFIKYPPREPEYRANRPHSKFVTNISVNKQEIRNVIISGFADQTEKWVPGQDIMDGIQDLVKNKYRTDTWNFMF